MITDTLFKTLMLATPATEEYRDICSLEFSSKLRTYGGGSSSKTNMYVNWSVALLRILLQPHTFEHATFPAAPRDESITEGRCMGFEYEDWYRAMCLLKWRIKDTTQGRGATGARSGSATKIIAKEPRYIQPEDEGRLAEENEDLSGSDHSDDDQARKRRKHFHLLNKSITELTAAAEEFGLHEEAETLRFLDATTINTAEFQDSTTHLERDLERTFQRTSRTGAVNKHKTAREPMSRGDVIKFCEEMNRLVQVMWGPADTDRMRSETINPSGASGLQLEQVIQLSAADAMPVEGLDDEELDSAKTSLSWSLREKMAAQGAALPPFKASCGWAGLDPSDLTIEGAPPLSGESKAPKYKAHQVSCKFLEPFPLPLIEHVR
jgi:hypothetical protein